MAKKITKMDNETVAVVENIQRRSISTKTDLEKRKQSLLDAVADIDEMLAVFTA